MIAKKSPAVPLLVVLVLALFGALPSSVHSQATELGNDIFAALAETVDSLTESAATDWSKVDIRALREHLVDMHRLTMDAEVDEAETPSGLTAKVTGSDRVMAAARRMLPMHVAMMGKYRGWSVELDDRGDALVLTLASDQDEERARIRGLGLFGFLSLGKHHRNHHRALAMGQSMHH